MGVSNDTISTIVEILIKLQTLKFATVYILYHLLAFKPIVLFSLKLLSILFESKTIGLQL